jgi:hypothetical protein
VAVKTASAYAAASAMPGPDEPAWTITGYPCSLRPTVSGPRTWKWVPT